MIASRITPPAAPVKTPMKAVTNDATERATIKSGPTSAGARNLHSVLVDQISLPSNLGCETTAQTQRAKTFGRQATPHFRLQSIRQLLSSRWPEPSGWPLGGDDVDPDRSTSAGAGAAQCRDDTGCPRGRHGQGRDRADRCLGEPGSYPRRGLVSSQKHGIVLETFGTQGAGETLQAVISGSADIGIGIGTAGAMRAFARGAPVRVLLPPMSASVTNTGTYPPILRSRASLMRPTRTR